MVSTRRQLGQSREGGDRDPTPPRLRSQIQRDSGADQIHTPPQDVPHAQGSSSDMIRVLSQVQQLLGTLIPTQTQGQPQQIQGDPVIPPPSHSDRAESSHTRTTPRTHVRALQEVDSEEDRGRRHSRSRRTRSEDSPAAYSDHSDRETRQPRRQRQRVVDLDSDVTRRSHHRRESSGHRTDNIRLLERFQRLNPPRFNGRGGPEAAETWYRGVSKLMERLHLPSSVMVSLATFNLQESADHWWRSVQAQLRARIDSSGDQEIDISWDQFTQLFHQRFIGEAARDLR